MLDYYSSLLLEMMVVQVRPSSGNMVRERIFFIRHFRVECSLPAWMRPKRNYPWMRVREMQFSRFGLHYKPRNEESGKNESSHPSKRSSPPLQTTRSYDRSDTCECSFIDFRSPKTSFSLGCSTSLLPWTIILSSPFIASLDWLWAWSSGLHDGQRG
jgi:hypothetical protein